jgi:hypothetical protein
LVDWVNNLSDTRIFKKQCWLYFVKGNQFLWSDAMESRKLSDKTVIIECRTGCAACCIAPSISSPIPGMPLGKPAGVRCVQLTNDYQCRLFGKPERPAVCISLQPSAEMCGRNAREAFQSLSQLERATSTSAVKRIIVSATG